jgi:hypothetical protein
VCERGKRGARASGVVEEVLVDGNDVGEDLGARRSTGA